MSGRTCGGSWIGVRVRIRVRVRVRVRVKVRVGVRVRVRVRSVDRLGLRSRLGLGCVFVCSLCICNILMITSKSVRVLVS